MPKLHVIVTSTRPGRMGTPIGKWFYDFASSHAGFDVELVEIADFNLPVFDEPNHPMMQKYEHEHTKAWAAKISEADAFVFVMPEYNYGTPPSMLNALDYLYKEWNYKPAGFVSYGFQSAGLRSVQMAKLVITSLKIVPLPEGVAIGMFPQHIADGVFTANEALEKSAVTMLDELARWASALQPLRAV